MPENFDVIIIGAGQAGGPLATAFGQSGKRTALIEKARVGGTCINVGCTPTKTMVASARIAYLAARAAQYGVNVEHVRVDMNAVRQRKRDIVERFRDGSERRLDASEKVELIYGEASFCADKTVTVVMPDASRRDLRAESIVINAGGRPAVPAITGLSDIEFLDSTSIMELDSVPDHLIIIGGGYVSLEFGQMFSRFGSKVTVLEQSQRFLAREDEDIAAALKTILEEDGLEIILDATTESVGRNENGYHVVVSIEGAPKTIPGSHILVATGRTLNSDSLNLEAAGIKPDARGAIPVNDLLETDVPGIFAVGDINGGPAFTHISYDDFRILRENLIEGGNLSKKGRLVPYTMYTDPQLGRVGITEREAAESELDVQVYSMPMSYIARASETSEPRGMMKAIVDNKSKMILGAAVLGIEAGEIMSMIQIAMMGKLPYTVLRDAVFAHPTIAEGLNNLFS